MEQSVTASYQATSSSGTYVLRELIRDVPLGSLDNGERSYITCVDAWNSNLYIGTSAGEVLHYVSIPSDGSDTSQPSYIFASKLEPYFANQQEGHDKGVKQILLLPNAGKACILCNGTLTFYTLPELSPAFGGRIKQSSCTWVGGMDLDEAGEEENNSNGTAIVICLKQRLRLIRIGKDASKIRDIELGGVAALCRRGDVACVADGLTYSLLDVVNQRKNDLFAISSLSTGSEQTAPESSHQGMYEDHSRQGRSHRRDASLAASMDENGRLRPGNTCARPARSSSRGESPGELSSSREPSPAGDDAAEPHRAEATAGPEATAKPCSLPANIVSPTPSEFLLTTGTRVGEPGIGMFVNLEGDPSRPPIEFSSYPESLVLEGDNTSEVPSTPSALPNEAYVLALVRRTTAEGTCKAIEIQPRDVMFGQEQRSRHWLHFESPRPKEEVDEWGAGLRAASSASEVAVSEVSSNLRLRRFARSKEDSGADLKRNEEEDKFAARFSYLSANVLLFANDTVSWLTRDPLVLQLERRLAPAVRVNANETSIDVELVQHVINSIRGQEPRDELEFLTLTYVRQRTSLLLFGHLILQTVKGIIAYERDKRMAEEALLAGNLDPRIVLSLVPPLKDEVQEGSGGIWIAQGLNDVSSMLLDSFEEGKLVQDTKGAFGDNLLPIIKRYLLAWRKKKGFGSVADEAHVFKTVDAALLRVLLLLDENTPRGPATPGSVRAELNEVVDHGVECFDRAVELFESFDRLFMLSRLYQSRKMVSQVLATWKRMLDGEHDAGGELVDGEQYMRRYLTNIRDQALVQQYGAYLACRNPKLGVQVFADDNSRVKFSPPDAVAVLKREAPAAVKHYLEHLVFAKNHTTYIPDLINFYLGSVLDVLASSSEVRSLLRDSYTTYRALQPPKPTYRQFLLDNPLADDGTEWWHARLRLLQLLGGSHGTAADYDVGAMGEKLAPYSEELVPEMVILNGREGAHEEALRLLTHGLADYDTAIRYCLLGGNSIFHPTSSSATASPPSLPSQAQQSALFRSLLHHFLRIDDEAERAERVAELLQRFGPWFEVGEVLDLIPDDWSVRAVEGFLVRALRGLVRERREAVVVVALEGARNLRWEVEIGEKVREAGPRVIREGEELEAG